jgi:hypothetical protein
MGILPDGGEQIRPFFASMILRTTEGWNLGCCNCGKECVVRYRLLARSTFAGMVFIGKVQGDNRGLELFYFGISIDFINAFTI